MIVKKVCNILSTIVLIVLLAAAAVILVPMLLGYKEMAVLSGSMEPTIPVGSLVYVKPVEASELEAGDVCTYYLSDGETFVTHRVMSIDPDAQTLVTQGDANESPDGDIQFSQVYGRADFHLPYLGIVIQNIRTPVGIMSICGVVMLVILLNFIPAIIDAAEDEKKQKAQQSEPEKAGTN
ncbi:signal peptidase I [Gemmiger sp. An194]|uniref:signal peptidase I n=1 Tax=Gemmiger sp. An194 TaxID=1965582 RepID=UPI000B379352|nr:signal peptidase I [Gemmiger sp. An194]OUP25175.1 signal peptidase I [Gemmiger sp. An194]